MLFNCILTHSEQHFFCIQHHFEGLAQERSNSSALAMELLQFCAKASI